MKAILAKGILVFFCIVASAWAETEEIKKGNSIFTLAMKNRPFLSSYTDRSGPTYKALANEIKYSVETLYLGLTGNYTVSRIGRARSVTQVSSILSFSAYVNGFKRIAIAEYWNASMSKGFMGPLMLYVAKCQLKLELEVIIAPQTVPPVTREPNLNNSNSTSIYTNSPDSGASAEQVRVAMRYVSSIGGGFSLGCLIITIFTIAFFKPMRRNQCYQILIYLCSSLAIYYFGNFFVVAAIIYPKTCTAVAVFLHFFLMSAVILMLLVGLYLCFELILFKKWWNSYVTNIICTSCGYGIPALVVIICLINNTSGSIYGSNASGYCWMKRVWADATFVYPMVGLLGVNCIFFVIITFKLINMSNQDRQFHLYRIVIPSAGLIFTLGLPWLFSIVAIHTTGTTQMVFSVIFTTLSSLQGVFIFFFYVLFNRVARQCWKHLLCNGPLPTETSYTNGKLVSDHETEIGQKNNVDSIKHQDTTTVSL
ncbi:uncharacterized protein TRIADDRAFT_57670 [Trichoplax adhaerens]|uniref:G-protein coupled receptors family 2 profile 2 domain-containing protein n=1 Tax=Trichoplax adhaerens TaxID=10228 RepID=B3S035_TRIAD|nr:hypothetical protein TRIADDRAFT_57670 [Trichoplax adhaerens]EDV24321.1 hypothetical protein TRIADDRAFT_57670 [Trichoplax adhaerens]|eukprot:XP_002113847.1 hypothetical protein TRIADDRAFT_57670 [Trichoplax adhaerens]